MAVGSLKKEKDKEREKARKRKKTLVKKLMSLQSCVTLMSINHA
jgi:hypothetical protein